MIKKIIQQLASEEISVTKALSLSKLVAVKIENDDFKAWLNYELLEYPSGSEEKMPEYRIFPIDVKGDVSDRFGNISYDVNLNLKKLSDKVEIDLNKHYERSSIEAIERLVKDPKSDYVINPLHPEMVRMLSSSIDSPGYTLINAYREYPIAYLNNILNQVKQKLLDTLLKLEEEFPNMEDFNESSKENKNKVQNIVNYNVFGGNPISNFGVGEKVIQKDIVINENVNELIKKLLELNVPEEDVNEVTEIISSTPKKHLNEKIKTWVGNLSLKIAEKGLVEKFPSIIETVNEFISKIGG